MRKTSRWAVWPSYRAAIGLALLAAASSPVCAATIVRTAEISAPVSEIWSLIGPFCAIKDWLPPVGECIQDGKAPPTRILVTKDGKAAFVETETARSEASRANMFDPS